MAGAAALLLAAPAPAEDGPIRLAYVLDGSPGSVPWRNGIELGLREINARGGILGRQVVLRPVAAPDEAAAGNALLLLAPKAPSPEPAVPVLSAERLAGDPAQDGRRLADHAAGRLKAQSVAVIAAPGADRAVMRDGLLRQLAARGVAVAADIRAEAQQVDFSAAVLRAKAAGADALVALVDAPEAPRLLREIERQGYDRPVLGDAALVSAAARAVGVTTRAVVGLTPAAPLSPIRDMVRSHTRTYGVPPDMAALVGYSAIYIAKAITERAGKAEPEAFARALNGAQLAVAGHPGVLTDIRFDAHGQARRGALLVESRNGEAVVLDLLPP